MKIPEAKIGFRCQCGHTWNAVNINANGVFTVHVCLHTEVVIQPNSSGYKYIKHLMEGGELTG